MFDLYLPQYGGQKNIGKLRNAATRIQHHAGYAAPRREHSLAITEFELFMKVEMHRVINLSVKSTNTIKSIKSMIQKMTKIPPNQQMLLLGKEQLRDERTLRDYNILKEMGLDLQLKWKVDRSLPKTKDYCVNSEEDGVEVLKMPCGHSMSSEGLMQYAKNEV